MGSKAGQAPLPRDVTFGDSCSGSKLLLTGGSEERHGFLQDSLGAGLGASRWEPRSLLDSRMCV